MNPASPLKMNFDQLSAFLSREFPQFEGKLVALCEKQATLALAIEHRHLRPGNTVSGPTLMALADVALYAVILSRIGPVALAVTTDFTCHFLNKPHADARLLACARILKQGKRLIIGCVDLYSEGQPDPVAHVVATYSVPPQT